MKSYTYLIIQPQYLADICILQIKIFEISKSNLPGILFICIIIYIHNSTYIYFIYSSVVYLQVPDASFVDPVFLPANPRRTSQITTDYYIFLSLSESYQEILSSSFSEWDIRYFVMSKSSIISVQLSTGKVSYSSLDLYDQN